MCGIVGFINNLKNFNYFEIKELIINMSDQLKHRGPDSADSWISKDHNVVLGHRRLSILDLSINGNQPMISFNNKIVISFNGEIYNHLNLRNEINRNSTEIINWRGTSDTETLVNGISIFGCENFLKKIRGMFAFAAWDIHNNELILARDGVGEKPLYYGTIGQNFVFSSELKSFEKFPYFKKEINRDALSNFNTFMYIPEPLSIYKDIFKLPPASYLQIKIVRENNINKIYSKKVKKWIDHKILNRKKINNRNFDECLESLNKKLTNSIETQLISDVPLGVFLSGGVDSSLITSILTKNLDKTPQTFTIGFKDKLYDESIAAKKISNYLGCEHNEFIFSEKYACEQIPNILKHNDEPFADSSKLPTTILSSFTRKKVTVALSGDGGDELFGGYNRYLLLNKIWNKYSLLPYPINKICINLLKLLPYNLFDLINEKFNFIDLNNIQDKANKIIDKLNRSNNINELYVNLLSEWNDSEKLILDNENLSQKKLNEEIKNLNFSNVNEMMMYMDFKYYLPDDILCKVDRSSMMNSLETRAPFLDLDVIKEAFEIPISYKLNKKNNKVILRKLLLKFLPEKLITKPKKGFGIPINTWLRGNLKDYVFDTININEIKNQGYYNSNAIQNILDEHYNKNRNWGHKIWSVLVFQSWITNNKI